MTGRRLFALTCGASLLSHACGSPCERIDYVSGPPEFQEVQSTLGDLRVDATREDVHLTAGLAPDGEAGWVTLTVTRADGALTLRCPFRTESRSIVRGTLDEVCRCALGVGTAKPCLTAEAEQRRGSAGYIKLLVDETTLEISSRASSPETVEIDVALDTHAVLAATTPTDAGPPPTVELYVKGLRAQVTRTVVEVDCPSSSGCGSPYRGWLPGK